MADLPAIVSGPILRRVDRSSVCIWIATSRRFEIGAELFRITGKAPAHTTRLLGSKCDTKEIRFGARLYLYLIKIVPTGRLFPAEELLGYNLLFTAGQKTAGLGDFGLLEPGEDSLVYGQLPYPSFFIHEGAEAKILYGSCRKLHGRGHDALAGGDSLLEETHENLPERPSALFLLGDQIYADDVADPVFPAIMSLSRQLAGKQENVAELDPRLKQAPFSQSINQIRGRKFIMNHFCQFTSAQSHNHLMQLPEYAVMYMLSFGPQLWAYLEENGEMPSFLKELGEEKIRFVFPEGERFRRKRQAEEKQHKARFAEQLKWLQKTIASLSKVRRLLANVPVYMIFDDHEITDDWNISHEWKEAVRHSPLGRHVSANGLGAYWAFQGWGNNPDAFDASFLEAMEKHSCQLDVASEAYVNWRQHLEAFDSWHFVAPTSPKAVFLDTRTKRVYDFTPVPAHIGRFISEDIQSPELVSQADWDKAAHALLQNGWNKGEAVIIASPAPMYGLDFIESIMNSYVYPLRAFGLPIQQLFDFEAWKYNNKGFSAFLHWVFHWRIGQCFVVSGDVHYASSVHSHVQSRNGKSAHIVQCTSSPMHNSSFTRLPSRFVKWLHWSAAIKRRDKKITHFYDGTYNELTQNKKNKTYYWKETVRYLSNKRGAIIETENNVGLLSFSGPFVQNRLVLFKALVKKERAFKKVKRL